MLRNNKLKYVWVVILLIGQCQGQYDPEIDEEKGGKGENENSNTPEAILYDSEERTGYLVKYSLNAKDFYDVPKLLVEHNLTSAALLCVRGVFVLYNNEYYQSESEDEVAILAGKDLETCLPPGMVKSMTLVQNNLDIFEDALTMFNRERFVSLPVYVRLTLDKQKEHATAKVMKMKEVRSFILMGKSSWTVVTRAEKNNIYCVSPGLDSEYPICPVPFSDNYFDDDGNLNWIEVTRGCPDGAQRIELDYCFDFGGELKYLVEPKNETSTTEPPTEAPPTEAPPQETNDTALATDATFLGSCNNLDEFAALLRLRITHDFISPYQVQFPLNKVHTWRTEILDNTFEAMRAIAPSHFIDPLFINFMRELYIYFAEKHVWSKGLGWPSKPKQSVSLVAHETLRCLKKLHLHDWGGISSNFVSELLSTVQDSKIPDNLIDEEFKAVPGYDTVMEFAWLTFNLVGASCHAALEYQTDFWMDYMNVVYDMYLVPVAGFWANPGKPLNYYPVLFGGFHHKRQMRSLAALTSAMYSTVKLDKLPRPMA